MEPETELLEAETDETPTTDDTLTPEEVQILVDFIGTFYPEEIEGVQRPTLVKEGVYSYVFQDGKKVVEAIVDEKKMTIASKILNPDEI